MADNDTPIDENNRWVHVGKPGYEHETMIYLDHSCDEWIVGDVADARRMITELQMAIEEYLTMVGVDRR